VTYPNRLVGAKQQRAVGAGYRYSASRTPRTLGSEAGTSSVITTRAAADSGHLNPATCVKGGQ
jgi:hypothetical protein